MSKTIVSTEKAPAAIGAYSQAVKFDRTVYLSGQIGLDPTTMILAEGVEAQIAQVFENLKAVAQASGGSLADIVKLTVYLTNLEHFAKLSETMGRYFDPPYPARAVIGVSSLPRAALVEADAVLCLKS